MVISGGGALWSDAAAALADWIEHTGMPFCTTRKGVAWFPKIIGSSMPMHARRHCVKLTWSWWSAHDSTMFSGTGRRSASPRR